MVIIYTKNLVTDILISFRQWFLLNSKTWEKNTRVFRNKCTWKTAKSDETITLLISKKINS